MRSSLLSAVAMLCVAACGCRPEAPPVEPIPPPPPGAPPAAPPAARWPSTAPAAPQGAVMATVNGQPLYMVQLHAALLRGQGLEIAQELIASEVVGQEARRRGVSVSEEEVQAEQNRLLAQQWPSLEEPEQRERALAQFLAQRGSSRVRWELICRGNALLRKMAEPNAVVTDAMLQAEYADQFGRKVEVRHIQVESLDAAAAVMKLLKAKVDFADLARRLSKNPSAANGGLLPPMTKTGSGEPEQVVRDVAFSLTEPGEVSEPVKVGYAFHLLQLVRYVEPTTAPSEDAKAKLRAALQEKVIRQWQQKIMFDLMSAAKYEFVDPVLREMNAKASNAP